MEDEAKVTFPAVVECGNIIDASLTWRPRSRLLKVVGCCKSCSTDHSAEDKKHLALRSTTYLCRRVIHRRRLWEWSVFKTKAPQPEAWKGHLAQTFW